MTVALTLGSLFTGIGGIDLGFERAGIECRWQVEIDPYCRLVLEKHWPRVTRYEDIRTVQADKLESVDVVAGGFPCKNTSNAAAMWGHRSGITGPDSGLWTEQFRIIDGLRPEWAVVENPPGIGTWAQTIKGCLEGIGYTVSRIPVSAAGAGAPHLRRRVFFIANRHGKRLAESLEDECCTAKAGTGGAVNGHSWLSSVSGVLRVDDGVPGRIHRDQRIACLGNAVVPQSAEWIGRLIVQGLQTTRARD